jgi:hypothetical protein
VKLKLDIPASWPTVGEGKWEPLPGVTLTLLPLRAIPADLRAWGDSVVLAGVHPSWYRVRNVDDLHTLRGWPLSIFFSDIISILPDPSAEMQAPSLYGAPPSSGPRVIERRLHGLYIFDDVCGAAVARSAHLGNFDQVLPDLRRAMLTGEPDWRGDDIQAVTQLWAGLSVTRVEPGAE